MTDAALPPAVAPARPATAAIQKRLKARYAREKRFRAYGMVAIGIAVLFLAVLLGSIVKQGYSAFYTHAVTAEVQSRRGQL